jgi:signal transduction histidine kinase
MSEAAVRELVLVVDDNLQNRLVAEGHLASAGYEVALAEDGPTALRLFEERPPSLVLLDVIMPKMDGFEVCARLRELPRGHDVPIVFLTASAEPSTYERALASGGDDFLTKPIQCTELLMRVRSLVRIRKMGRELEARAATIERQNAALLRAKQAEDELASFLVHDLKGPVASITANCNYLLGEPGLGENAAVVEDVLSAAERLQQMIVNLLDVRRSEEGALVVRRAELSPATLLESVAKATTRRAWMRRQRVVVDVRGAPPIVRADRDLLQRVLENLVDNACKYSPEGATIRLAAGGSESSLELRVVDDGPGIAPEYRDKIFDKYVQLERDAAKHARTSRGLGLVFCRVAAEAHGGTIRVEDAGGRGTAFVIEIPRAA